MRVGNLNRDTFENLISPKREILEQRYPKLSDWVEGSLYPTYIQLAKIAKTVNVPFGYFFLEEVPEYSIDIPHFRTNNSDDFIPSDNLKDTLKNVSKKQKWAKDLLVDVGAENLDFANSLGPDSSVREAVERIRTILNLETSWASSLFTWKEALRILIEKTELSGVFVVMNGVVGNNTRRKLELSEFRGFVLYDEIAPFVFINGTDYTSGKIFTLIHEIAHILLGSSASFDLSNLISPDDEIEDFCNKVAAEFLVPGEELTAAIRAGETQINNLTTRFKVSRVVIARRLLDLEVINKKKYFELYNSFISKESIANRKPGGNFYNSAPYKVSRKFFHLVDSSVQRNKLLYRDAFKLTGLRSSTYDEYKKRNT